MSMGTCVVSVSILGLEPSAASREVVLGEFHGDLDAGVSIGSDPNCTVVLPDLAPVAVLIIGASNHKMVFRLPEGASLPLPPRGLGLPGGDRVDDREIHVGPYKIRFR